MALLLSLTLIFGLASTAGAYNYGYGGGSLTLNPGQSTTLNANFPQYYDTTGAGATMPTYLPLMSVEWSSTGSVSVSGYGNTAYVTAGSSGTGTVTATAYYGYNFGGATYPMAYDSQSWTVTISGNGSWNGGGSTGSYASLSSSSLSFAAANSASQSLSVYSQYGYGLNVYWYSSNPSVAQVSGSGQYATVTPKGNGYATITAQVGISGYTTETLTCSVTVGSGAAGSYKADLSTSALNLSAPSQGGWNTSGNLTVTARNGYSISNIQWTSSNTNVATVSGNSYSNSATVTAKAAGTATVTAYVTMTNGATETLSCVVTVGGGGGSGDISLSQSALTMNINSSASLTAYVASGSAGYYNYITWTSSDASIVSVSPSYTTNGGAVTLTSGYKTGTATITASIYNAGVTQGYATCVVTVGGGAINSVTATVGANDRSFTLGSTNASTPTSIVSQIAAAVSGNNWITGKTLSYVMFTNVTSNYGSLNAAAGTPYYYYSGTSWNNSLSNITFIPTGYAGTASFAYVAYATDGTSVSGTINITVGQSSNMPDVIYSITSGQSKTLDASDFNDFWTKATSANGKLNYVVLGTPSGNVGRLTYRSTNGQTISGNSTPLYANPSYNQVGIGSVTFTPSTMGSTYSTGTLTVPFTAYGTENGYGATVTKSGTLAIVVTKNQVSAITARAAGGKITMKSSDFVNAYKTVTGANTAYPVVSIQLLSLPAYGTLYSNYNSSTQMGTTLSNGNYANYSFTSGTATSTVSSIDGLTYVPGSFGMNDSFRYALFVNGTLQFVGTVTLQVKSDVNFTDVKKGSWYYEDVMAMAAAGVINGTSATTFSPEAKTTYGQALKMIMLAAGYSEQERTTTHWASGYLARAIKDGLVSGTVNLDAAITREAVASIAVKAMGLSPDYYTASPFTDSKDANAVALYRIGIIKGAKNLQGKLVFDGSSGLKRNELCSIVNRIYNYK